MLTPYEQHLTRQALQVQLAPRPKTRTSIEADRRRGIIERDREEREYQAAVQYAKRQKTVAA